MSITYPDWVRVRQKLDKKRCDNPYRAVIDQLDAMLPGLPQLKGKRIAVTAGSRYIDSLVPITKAVIDFVISQGGQPFLVPSMGSHGGATAHGQLKVVEDLGLTQEALSAPIQSSMEVDQLGTVENIPVFMDRLARQADGIVLINRIKPHQVFKGDIQSGLNKMLVIGLGKKKGADAVHNTGRIDVLGTLGDYISSRVSVLFGVAILENSYDEVRDVAVLAPGQFKDYDKTWCSLSRSIIPKIPVRDLDLVIIDKMGKDISGSGMDTNVIGFTRRMMPSGQLSVPLAVLDLTKKSEGNAMGIGLADFTTRKLVSKINYRTTYANVLATGIYSTGRIPVTLETDRDILDTILQKLEQPEIARIIRISDTLHLDSFLATESLAKEIATQATLAVEGDRIKTHFSADGSFDF